MAERLAADLLVHNAAELCTMTGAPGSGAEAAGIVHDGAVAGNGGRVVWVGPSAEVADHVDVLPGAEILDAAGHVVTPGLVDPHTHLVFAGDRSAELSQRLAGATYLDVARAGGGIQATVQATRAMPHEELLELSITRATRLLEQGVTTCEVKSGYGLGVEAELELLRVIRDLSGRTPLEIVPTLLALHALPLEARADRAGYVAEIATSLVPRAAAEKLCRMVDAFLEEGAFSTAEVEQVFEAARKHGLALRLHADQLSPGQGAQLAAAAGALSADHLEHITAGGIEALAKSGTVAVLAPVATWYLRLPAHAPARRLLEAGVEIALCTNWNPGSAPSENVALTLGAACLTYGLQPAEALRAFTAGAARALGLHERVGRLAPGFDADLAVFGCGDHRHLASHLAVDHARAVVKRGKLVARPHGQVCA